MQSVIYASIAKTDLFQLFGISENRFRQWVKQGLPREPDSRFSLFRVIRWREERHEIDSQLMTHRVNQKELVALLGVSRQAVAVWRRAGL